jgi:hypothetical protein
MKTKKLVMLCVAVFFGGAVVAYTALSLFLSH